MGTQAAGRIRLLVVDDEALVARAIRRVLASEYAVTLAYSAADALNRLEAGERFEVILSDVSMPEMDGMQFYERILAAFPEMASGFILLTGGNITPILGRFLETHRRPYLGKPFQASDLKKLINARITARSLPASSL